MSISTYAELKTAISGWLNREDITDSVLEDIIFATECRIAGAVKLRAMEVALSETLATTEQTVAYPTDALELKGSLYLTKDDSLMTLTHVSEEVLKTAIASQDPTVDGTPRYFYITPDNYIFFDVIADDDYPITGTYYKRLVLSDSSTTNWVLTNWPMLYLYGCMSEAKTRIDDDPRRYDALYSEQLAALMKQENRTSRASGPQRLRQQSLDGDAFGIFGRRL